MKLLILCSSYNESETIVQVLTDIEMLLDRLSSAYVIKCLIVDDGSKDSTLKSIKLFLEESSYRDYFEVIQNKVNRGLSYCVGMAASFAEVNGYDYLVKMDADGQMDVNVLPEAITQALEKGVDIVSVPFVKLRTKKSIRLDIFILSGAISIILGKRVKDVLSDFRVYNKTSFKYLVEESKKCKCYSLGIGILKYPLSFYECKKSGVIYEVIRPFPVDGMIEIRLKILEVMFTKWRGVARYLFGPVLTVLVIMHFIYNLIFNNGFNSLKVKNALR